jgi:Flp pilus assembly pilin Flp
MAQCKKPEEYKERQAAVEYVLILSLVAVGVWFVSYVANPGKHLATLLTEVEATMTKVGLNRGVEERP